MIKDVYVDGGCIGSNPSALGGTWAWCFVDEKGQRTDSECGHVTPQMISLPLVTNNLTELLAAIHAMEALPDGWDGTIHTDSQVTWRRITRTPLTTASGKPAKPQKFKGIPVQVRVRLNLAMARMGKYNVATVGGHPTGKHFADGHKGGAAVSVHNMFVDDLCNKAKEIFLKTHAK